MQSICLWEHAVLPLVGRSKILITMTRELAATEPYFKEKSQLLSSALPTNKSLFAQWPWNIIKRKACKEKGMIGPLSKSREVTQTILDAVEKGPIGRTIGITPLTDCPHVREACDKVGNAFKKNLLTL